MTQLKHETGIILKSPREIGHMREAGRIAAAVLAAVAKAVKPGVTTGELDDIAVGEVIKRGAEASFKGYRGFPKSICVSLNEEVVHGIPGSRVLREGEIVSLDFGVEFNGLHGDAAVTVGVGKVSRKAQEIMRVTESALEAGIRAARHKAYLGDVSAAIQSYVESRGFSVVREYTGHGIGYEMHEEPQIPNFGRSGEGPLLVKGMTLAIEPMVNVGGWQTKVKDNQWTVVTADGSLSAHFEHTIAVFDTEPEILTRQ